MRVAVGGHNGAADPRRGPEAAPVLPLVAVDGQAGVPALDGHSAPRLPGHQPWALQCTGGCRQREKKVHGERVPSVSPFEELQTLLELGSRSESASVKVELSLQFSH